MKKTIYILLSIAAVLGCTKTGVEYDDAQIGEITVSPVAGGLTKAAVTDGVFPSGNHIGMYAFYTREVEAGTVADYTKFTTEFFDNVEFHCESGSDTWDGLLSDYYWPTTGSLVFAGYSLNVPNEGQTESTPNGDVTYNLAEDKLIINDYVQSSETDKTYDLLYFGRTQQSYSKKSTSVPVVFKHALAWIEVQVKGGTGALFGENNNRTWKATKVEFKGIDTKGDFEYKGVQTAATANTNLVKWTNHSEPEDVVVYDGSKELTDRMEPIETNTAGTLVIPQAADKLYVTIEYNSPAGDPIKEVVEINIPAHTSVWEAGKKYTYQLTFSPQEILVAPNVERWPDPTNTTPTI